MHGSKRFLLLTIWVGIAGLAGTGGAQAAPLSPTEAVDSRLTNKTASRGTFNILAKADWEKGESFVYNPNLWCSDLTVFLTCFSPWNSRQHDYEGGTLITPKHAIFAEHFSGASGSNPIRPGDKLVFLGKTGINYPRTLKSTPERVGSSDICVGTFNEPNLPPDVVPARVLPAGLKDNFLPAGTPVIFCNKNKEAHVAELVSLTGVVIRPATDPKRAPWTLGGPTGGPAFVGDSGSPIFAVIDDRLVLLALFMAPNAGPPVSSQIEGINALLGRGYKLDVMKVEGK